MERGHGTFGTGSDAPAGPAPEGVGAPAPHLLHLRRAPLRPQTYVVTWPAPPPDSVAPVNSADPIRAPSDRLFRTAVESSPTGVVMVDLEGTIILVNRETERMFGYDRDELLGRPVDMLVPPPARDAHPGFRRGFHSEPRSRSMGAGRDLHGRRKDGTEVPVEIGLSPVEIDGSSFVIASVVDITARRDADEELRRSNEELERFAYVASHDLQEPLRMVASYVQLIERRYADALDDAAREFVAFAVDGARRMQSLIQDLLAFSRVGTRGGAIEPTELEPLVDQVLEGLGAAVADARAGITRDPLPTVLGDPPQLRQLFANLLGNAIKFRGDAPPAGARRRPSPRRALGALGARQRDRHRRRVLRTHLRDLPAPAGARGVSGHRDRPGALQEDRRATRRTHRGGVDAGRGLDVLLHPPRGTGVHSVNETLPVEILLVEDSLPDVRLTQEALKEAKVAHRLHVVHDGVQALDFLLRRAPWTQAPRPDLILLDLNLPRKDGREVLHDLGGHAELCEIPVVVLTTSEAEQDISQSYRLGANAFVTKPVDLERFLEAVRSIEHFWLETARLHRSMGAAR